MAKLNIVAFSGSLRVASTNTGLLRAIKEIAGDAMNITIIDIGSLPLYNQDLEATSFPAVANTIKSQIRAADGIIIATPEFNRSIPGVLKNLIDWTSRPYGDDSWSGRPVAVVGASLGPIATALAQYHLKQILLYLNARVMGQPEFYVGSSSEKFDKDGNLTDEKTKEYIKRLIEKFETFIKK